MTVETCLFEHYKVRSTLRGKPIQGTINRTKDFDLTVIKGVFGWNTLGYIHRSDSLGKGLHAHVDGLVRSLSIPCTTKLSGLYAPFSVREPSL